ncbi:MAG: alpha/beta fold hydrolase [Marmoricola sp.]
MADMVLVLDNSIELDEGLFELRRDGAAISLEPQAFDVLVYLIRHRDRVVAKEELMDAVWGGRFVSETAVTSRIKQVRRALGDDGQSQRIVRTLHGRGYRFVADVTEPAGTSADRKVPAPRGPSSGKDAPVRYTTSDGLHIAYQVTGGGEIDIVLISGFISHLDLDWDDPRHAYFLDGLGSMGRLIRFDKRGTGMSDRPPGVPDLEHRMHDVLAVMDAVGSERAVLCGYSEGGPMALMMAAMHPERVRSLVLYGSYARRTWAPDFPWAQKPEDREAYTEQLVTGWDWEADLRMRCPSGDKDMQRWWTRRMRASATPGTIRALMDMNALVDVRELLPRIRVPALVLQRTSDPFFPVQDGRFLADNLADATLVELEGADHLPAGNPAQILDAIAPFVSTTPRLVHELALAAVASPAGPTAAAVADRLVAAGGRRRRTTGGEVVVLFDGPATAVRAGLATLADEPGSSIGLAIAEVPVGDEPVSGQGVDWALSLGARAAPGELLVTSTAGTLLAPSTIRLEPREDGSFRAHPV